MIFIVLGDIHLGKGSLAGKISLGSALNSRVIDQINLLDWTLEQAISRGARAILITGDVFEDPKPHPSLITLFISWLKRCCAHNIDVHIALGNHDILRSGNFYTSPLDIISECELSNVFIHKELTTVFFDSIAFTFLPFCDRKSFNVESNIEALSILRSHLSFELSSIPITYRKLLIGHLALKGSIPVGDEIDDLSNELFCPLEMFQGYHYTIMGHVHKPQIMQHSPHISHIGSMDISNFGETDQQKALLIFDSEENTLDKAILPTRPLKKICISVPENTMETTEFVLKQLETDHSDLSKAIVRLEINLTSPDLLSTDRSRIEQHLLQQGVFSISAISETKKLPLPKKDIAIETMNTSMELPSAIKLWAETQIEKDKRELFLQTAFDLVKEIR